MSARSEADLFGAPGALSFTDEEFAELARILEARCGLAFSIEKRREFELRMAKRLSEMGAGSARELLDRVGRSDEALQKLINAVTIGESYFFRNRPHFNAIRETIVPDLMSHGAGQRQLRIWCAGCAGGEEPYSMAILLREHFPRLESWNVSIVATDINTEFLTLAQSGVYRQWSFRGVDAHLIDKYFNRDHKGRYHLRDFVKAEVRFERFNLMDSLGGARPGGGADFDLVMCRNVLIYFPFQLADRIVERLGSSLRPGGYLFVGHSEAFPSLGRMQVVYSHATYYYRRYLTQAETEKSAPPPRTLSIPGLGVGSIHPRLSSASIGLVAPAARRPVAKERRAALLDLGGAAKETAEKDVATLIRARQLADQGKTAEALEVLRTLADGEGNLDHRVHFLRAIVADQSGATKEAVKSLKQAIFLERNFAIGHYFLAVICHREGDLAMAGRHFRNVRNLLGNLPDDHELEEAEGLTAARLREIVASRTDEVQLA